MELSVKISDIDKILRIVENLADVDKDKVIKEGLRNATNLFINAGRRNLKARLKNQKGVTGNLLKSFKNKVKKNKLGALGGFNKLGNHAHLVDSGTKDRYTKSGKYTGKMPANYFWSAAISSEQNSAMNKVFEGINRGITRIINRN